MKATHAVAVAALSLACLATSAEARCKREPMPTVLDAIVVTPNGAYSLAEWEQKQADKQHLEETKVVLAPVVVTPNDEFASIEKSEKHDYAHASTGTHSGMTSQASSAPGAPLKQPSFVNFLRRLFF